MVTGGFDFDAGFIFGGGIWVFDFWNLDENIIHTFSFTGMGIDIDIPLSKIIKVIKGSTEAMRTNPFYKEALKSVTEKLAMEGIEAVVSKVTNGPWHVIDSFHSSINKLSDVDITGKHGTLHSAGVGVIVGYKALIFTIDQAISGQRCDGFSAGIGINLIPGMVGQWSHEGERPGPVRTPLPPPPKNPTAFKGRVRHDGIDPPRRP
jgi:hypothetical protein